MNCGARLRQEPVVLMIVTDLVCKRWPVFPHETVINNNRGKLPAFNRN